MVFLALLLLHGTFWAFLLNGFHELVHKSVFKTKALNLFFLYLFSFLGWYNPVLFWASHQEHHKYTLHPPDDMEVILPVNLSLAGFLKSALVNPWEFYIRLKGMVRLSLGRLEGEWENVLFPPTAVAQRRALFTWARFVLVGHALIAAARALFWPVAGGGAGHAGTLLRRLAALPVQQHPARRADGQRAGLPPVHAARSSSTRLCASSTGT